MIKELEHRLKPFPAITSLDVVEFRSRIWGCVVNKWWLHDPFEPEKYSNKISENEASCPGICTQLSSDGLFCEKLDHPEVLQGRGS
jgi:hypothetical protein